MLPTERAARALLRRASADRPDDPIRGAIDAIYTASMQLGIRQAPTAAVSHGGFTVNHSRKVWDRDGWACVQCGTHRDLTVDHVVATSRGGSDEMSNLQTLCRSCNSRKGAR